MKKLLILFTCAVMSAFWTAEAVTINELRTPDLNGLNVTDQEREALEFLYAYMPLADVTDYTVQFHLENIRATFEAREQMPWGKKVPELLFNHFVLPLRVNNEALDMSRPVFFNELKDNEEWYTTNGFGCDLEIWLDGIHMGEPTVIAYD